MGHYVELVWEGNYAGRTRAQRSGGRYAAYVPSPLADFSPSMPPELVASISEAEAALAEFESTGGHLAQAEPLARILLRSEAVSSSRIEALEVPVDHVLVAEALDELGVSRRMTSAEASVLNSVAIMADGFLRDERGNLTLQALCDANARLLEGSGLEDRAGRLRDEQNWAGASSFSPLGARFVPPPPSLVEELMDDLVRFCNESRLPAVVVAAMAHAQFETIHPFVDGNGRTGRMLIHELLALSGAGGVAMPPISLVLSSDREAYLAALGGYQSYVGDDYGPLMAWIAYFCGAVVEATNRARALEERVDDIRRQWMQDVKPRAGSAAALLLQRLADNPVVSVKSAMRLTGRSHEAARLAIIALEKKHILRQSSKNRKSGLWVADEVLDAVTSYERMLATKTGDTRLELPVRHVPQRRAR